MVKRLNADFGNSTSNFLIDGYYFEMPTDVVEISKQEAERMFVSPIEEKEDLLGRLMISTGEDKNKKFYLVGEFAEGKEIQSHVNTMTDKIHSIIPYACFLGAIAYYSTINDINENIEIENMKMMLPIWLLKRADKFSIAQKEMANRFIGEHHVNILTMGMEKQLKIIVKSSKCEKESEVARYALKYKMLQNSKESTIKIEKRLETQELFKNFSTILCDIGGGSTDCVKLEKNLTSPKERNSFKVIDVEPFLGALETFRKEKLLQYFTNIKELEKFLIENYKKQKYVLNDKNTGKSYDFTKEFTEMLQSYARKLVIKIFNTFATKDEILKFIYFGGEAPVLKPYIKNALLGLATENIIEENHLFLDDILSDNSSEVFKPTSRTINLVALELLSLSEESKKETQKEVAASQNE